MSTHGRTGVGRWLLGSVTASVIGRASVPVLVIRPPQMPLSPAAAWSVAREAQTDEPPFSVTLTPRQAEVVRLALEHLAWTSAHDDNALPEIREALTALEAAQLAKEEGHG
jgi:hypothetical protein